ncbi:MAG TPA: helix-turn-helix domain-containing protein [Candidatus Paceibacterota bacterium]
MFTSVLEQLGLPTNEAKIYETLVRFGNMPAGQIATKAKINRRNVYDSLSRLTEKGLVFEIIQKHDSIYRAVDPKKLSEIIREKDLALQVIMPDLEKLYGKAESSNVVFEYKGLEGWKNYMQDILRVKEDVFALGARGGWMDGRLKGYFEEAMKESKRLGIKYHMLFDSQAVEKNKQFVSYFPADSRVLPTGFSTSVAIDTFGDYTVILSGVGLGQIEESASVTVILNPNIADAFRTWWQFMWSVSKPINSK